MLAFLHLDDIARIMLGNPPPELPRKHMPLLHLWQAYAPAACATFARELYVHLLRAPQPALLTPSSEESDGYVPDAPDFIPLLPPPGFAFDQNPPDPLTLEPMQPQGSTLIDRYILFKWEHNHALTPTTYNHLLDARAPTNTWVLLSPLP